MYWRGEEEELICPPKPSPPRPSSPRGERREKDRKQQDENPKETFSFLVPPLSLWERGVRGVRASKGRTFPEV
jgi:hypothetical protein